MTDPENETVYFLKSSLAAGENPVFHFTADRVKRLRDQFRFRSVCGYRLQGFDAGCRHTISYSVPLPRHHAERIGRPCRRCRPVENGTRAAVDAQTRIVDVVDLRLGDRR